MNGNSTTLPQILNEPKIFKANYQGLQRISMLFQHSLNMKTCKIPNSQY